MITRSLAASKVLRLRTLQNRVRDHYLAAQRGVRNPRWLDPNTNALRLYPSGTAPTVSTSGSVSAPYSASTTAGTGTGLPLNPTTEAHYLPFIRTTLGWRTKITQVLLRDTTTSSPNTDYTTYTNALGGVQRCEFNTDDPKPIVEVQGQNSNVRVIVDDMYVDLTGVAADPAAGNGTRYLQIDFTRGGTVTPPVKMRKIQCEVFSLGFGRVLRSGFSYSVAATPDNVRGPTIGIMGDSWSIGGGAGDAKNAFARQLADQMGLPELGINGAGNTGYATPTATVPYQYLGRIPDFAHYTASGEVDIIAITGLTNDISALNGATLTLANLTTAINTFYDALRTAQPNAVIVACPGHATNDTLTNATAAEAAVVAKVQAMQAAGDKMITYVRAIAPDNGAQPYLRGTGNTGAVANNGNRDIFIGTAVAAHPNDAGHAYVAERYAPDVVAAILAL